MLVPRRINGTRSRKVGPLATVALLVATATAGSTFVETAAARPGAGDDGSVVKWIDRHAVPLTSTDPTRGMSEVRSLRKIVRGGSVVGLGESTHGSREQFRVKHRMVRFLVERMGFRTFALEDDFASGVSIDRYVRTGKGDSRELVSSMSSPFWATQEMLALVRWMRSYNKTHQKKVRFLGTDLLQLRQLSFDEVTDYVRRIAPERLDDLQRHLHPVRMRANQFTWYEERSERREQQLIAHARRASRLVAGLVDTGSRFRGEHAEQHARAILGWYVNFAEETGFRGDREVFIADSIQWWQRLTGDKVAYWAANAHTTTAPRLTYRNPWERQTGTMAGGHLARRLHNRYVAIGTWIHHGAISSNYLDPGPQRIGPPSEALLEATLGEAAPENYLLNLRGGAPQPVRAWLAGQSTMRVILPSYAEGQDGNDYTMTVPSLAKAFDAAVFIRVTTASRLLDPP